jgi:hypothetical protein
MALNPYCDAVGIPYNEKDDPIYRNAALVDWMKEVPEMKGWTTYELVLFVDWLWRNNLKVK